MHRSLKTRKSSEELIQLLQSRGLEVEPDLARQWLANVSYYRLSGYWYPARKFGENPDVRLNEFQPGYSFRDATDLYEADRKLRTLIHDGMERIEIAMRTQVTEHLCAQQPNDPALYLSSRAFRKNFDHVEWLYRIYGRLNRSARTMDSIRHHIETYDGMYPLWVVAEAMDFSDISVLFSGLEYEDQRAIAENLGLILNLEDLSKKQKSNLRKKHPFAGWVHQFTIIRNTCAHHSRLWNKSFKPVSIAGLRGNGSLAVIEESQSERIFDAIAMMAHVLREVSPGTTWPKKVVTLLTESFLPNPLVEPRSLGIPENWDSITI